LTDGLVSCWMEILGSILDLIFIYLPFSYVVCHSILPGKVVAPYFAVSLNEKVDCARRGEVAPLSRRNFAHVPGGALQLSFAPETPVRSCAVAVGTTFH
jgi:hypothetical protein